MDKFASVLTTPILISQRSSNLNKRQAGLAAGGIHSTEALGTYITREAFETNSRGPNYELRAFYLIASIPDAISSVIEKAIRFASSI